MILVQSADMEGFWLPCSLLLTIPGLPLLYKLRTQTFPEFRAGTGLVLSARLHQTKANTKSLGSDSQVVASTISTSILSSPRNLSLIIPSLVQQLPRTLARHLKPAQCTTPTPVSLQALSSAISQSLLSTVLFGMCTSWNLDVQGALRNWCFLTRRVGLKRESWRAWSGDGGLLAWDLVGKRFDGDVTDLEAYRTVLTSMISVLDEFRTAGSRDDDSGDIHDVLQYLISSSTGQGMLPKQRAELMTDTMLLLFLNHIGPVCEEIRTILTLLCRSDHALVVQSLREELQTVLPEGSRELWSMSTLDSMSKLDRFLAEHNITLEATGEASTSSIGDEDPKCHSALLTHTLVKISTAIMLRDFDFSTYGVSSSEVAPLAVAPGAAGMPAVAHAYNMLCYRQIPSAQLVKNE